MDSSDETALSPGRGGRSRRNSGATSVTYPLAEDSAARYTLDTVQRLHSKLHDFANDNSRLDDTNAKLHRQLRDQIDKNGELQARLTDAENARRWAEQKLQDYRRQTQTTIDKHEDQLVAVQTEKARIESDLVLRDRQIIALQSQLDNKQRFIQELERTILENHAQFREQLARTLSTEPEGTARYEESENVRKAFQESLEMLKQTFEERVVLLKQRHQLEQTMQHTADQNREADLLAATHMDEITKLTQAFTKRTIALQESIHAFEALLQAKDSDIAQLESTNRQLEEELNSVRQSNQSVESAVAARLQRLREQYEEDKRDLEATNAQLQADVKRFRDQLAQAAGERDTAKEQLRKLQSEIGKTRDEYDDEVISLRTQLRNTTAELERLRIDHDTLKIQLANQTEECTQLRQQKTMDELLSADQSNDLQRLKMDAAQARAEADVAVREKQTLEHRNRELSNRLSKLEQERLERQAGDNRTLQELLKELQEEKAAHLVIREEKQSLERKVDRLTTEKQALDDALRVAEQRRAQAQSAQVQQLESELDSLRDSLTKQRARAAEEKAALSRELQDEKTARLQQQVAAREEQNALRDQLQKLERKLERTAGEKQALQDALHVAEQRRGEKSATEMRLLETELKNARDKLTEEKTRAAEEKDAIRQQLARVEERYRGATAENEAAFQRAEAYSRDLTAARETIRAQKERIRDLEKRLAQANESEDVEALRDEILVLKTQLKYFQSSRPHEGTRNGVEAGTAPAGTLRQMNAGELHGIIDDIHETFKSTVRSQQHTIDRLQSKGERTYESPPADVDELAPIVSDMRLYLQKARSQVAWRDECIVELGEKLAQTPNRSPQQASRAAPTAAATPDAQSVDGTSSTISYRRVNEKAGVPLPSVSWSRSSSPQPTGITGAATRTTRASADDVTPGRRSGARMAFEAGENRQANVVAKPTGMAWTAY